MADSLTLSADPNALTPCELVNGRWYKRDDKLAFSNGVNGKVRTSLFLARTAAEAGADALVYGGSVHAPALGRVASAAAYVGLDCYLVIGSDIKTARRHPTVAVAEDAGAMFLRSKVAYNPALQKLAREVAENSDGSVWQVPYGVSAPDTWGVQQTATFLGHDADQVDNIPDEVETLVIPFGSGNAAAGILYGLAASTEQKRIVLVGVGPDRREWLGQRLNHVGVSWDDLPPVEYLTLHPHFAEYTDRMPETQDGIDFHPTYEGKVVRYLDALAPAWWTARDERTCMWIVGGPL